MFEIDGDKLRAAREAAFFSQRQLAIESGVAQATISKFETGGKSQNVRGLTVRRLASALGIPPTTFASVARIEDDRRELSPAGR